MDNLILISTKSLDVTAQSYQNPSKLKNILNKYADDINGFGNNYVELDDTIEWGTTAIKNVSEHKKVLEIILPDTILNNNSLQVLNEFQKTMGDSGIEVWYRIAQ